MLLKELIKGLEIIKMDGSCDIEISSITYDSRKAVKGSLFVCKGFGFDKKYIYDAIENGAAAILLDVDAEIPDGVTVVKVKDARYALAHVSDVFYGSPSKKLKIVGVTGTKGKTTTTFMIKSILEAEKQKVGLIGTVKNMIGDEVLYAERTTPESLDLQSLFSQMREKNVDTAVMEVTSHALDLHRVSCVDFDIGVFTNLSRCHLDYHKTFENYLNAKAKLFKMCKKGLVNVDNEYGEEIIKQAECEVLTYAIDKDADIKAKNVSILADRVEFDAMTPWGTYSVVVGTPGKFSVYNALAAIGVCGMMGVSSESIVKGLRHVSVPGRVEVVETGTDYTVIIDFAHSPDSLENILTAVKSHAPGRVICLFGCGGDRDKTMRPIMGEISGRIADFSIITSDNPRTEDPASIVQQIEEGIKKTTSAYITIVDRREAIKYALMNAKPGDTIILAGKGHETYQQFKDKTIHFDEREVVREILQEISAGKKND